MFFLSFSTWQFSPSSRPSHVQDIQHELWEWTCVSGMKEWNRFGYKTNSFQEPIRDCTYMWHFNFVDFSQTFSMYWIVLLTSECNGEGYTIQNSNNMIIRESNWVDFSYSCGIFKLHWTYFIARQQHINSWLVNSFLSLKYLMIYLQYITFIQYHLKSPTKIWKTWSLHVPASHDTSYM